MGRYCCWSGVVYIFFFISPVLLDAIVHILALAWLATHHQLLQHVHSPLLLIILNYIPNISWVPELSTKDCPVHPFLHLQEHCFSKYLIYIQLDQGCIRCPLRVSGMGRFSTQDVNLHTDTHQLVWAQQELPGGFSMAAQNSHLKNPAAISQTLNCEGGYELSQLVDLIQQPPASDQSIASSMEMNSLGVPGEPRKLMVCVC